MMMMITVVVVIVVVVAYCFLSLFKGNCQFLLLLDVYLKL